MTKTDQKKIRCIICPEGCMLQAGLEASSKEIISLEGYKCKKGIRFARDEITNPSRIITTTVSIDSGIARRLAVRSDIPAPKEKIIRIIKAVKQKKVKAPVRMGDIIMADVLGTGVNIISSSTVEL